MAGAGYSEESAPGGLGVYAGGAAARNRRVKGERKEVKEPSCSQGCEGCQR